MDGLLEKLISGKKWRVIMFRRKNQINGYFLEKWLSFTWLRNCKSGPKELSSQRLRLIIVRIWFIWGMAKGTSVKISNSWICKKS